MLRTRVVPAARECLRSARKGRGGWSARATFEFVLARREIAETRVAGTLDRMLSACLAATLERLDVPPLSGRIRVRYPIYTLADAADPPVELSTEVAGAVDEITAGAPKTPPPAASLPARSGVGAVSR